MADTFSIPEPTAAAEPVNIVDDPGSVDPAAPHGRFGNGKPRKAPAKQSRRSATPTAPKASTPRGTKKPAAPDFRPVITEAANVLSTLLMGLGRHNRAFLADAATVQMSAANGAHVLNEIAKINPVIERALSVSAPAVPYVMAGNFLFTLGVQLAANHGKAVAVPGMKVHDPRQLADAMERQMQVAAEQLAADEAADQAEAEAERLAAERFAGA